MCLSPSAPLSCVIPKLQLLRTQPSTCSRAWWFPWGSSGELWQSLTWPQAGSAISPAALRGDSLWVLVFPQREVSQCGRLCQPCAWAQHPPRLGPLPQGERDALCPTAPARGDLVYPGGRRRRGDSWLEDLPRALFNAVGKWRNSS